MTLLQTAQNSGGRWAAWHAVARGLPAIGGIVASGHTNEQSAIEALCQHRKLASRASLERSGKSRQARINAAIAACAPIETKESDNG